MWDAAAGSVCACSPLSWRARLWSAMRPRPAGKNTAQQGNWKHAGLGQQDSDSVDEHCHAEYIESCKFPGKLSFQISLFTCNLHMLLCTMVPSWWPVFADAGGRNTGTTQILTSIFTELFKSHALNLQVLLDLSDICHCSCRQLIPTSIFSVNFILYIHLLQVFFLTLELNPYEKNVENIHLWDCCTTGILYCLKASLEFWGLSRKCSTFHIQGFPQFPDVCCDTVKCHILI